jgi:hypothetical protein
LVEERGRDVAVAVDRQCVALGKVILVLREINSGRPRAEAHLAAGTRLAGAMTSFCVPSQYAAQ